jgi:hypothetical protein
MVKQTTPARHPKKTQQERIRENHTQLVYNTRKIQDIVRSYNKMVKVNQEMLKVLQLLFTERQRRSCDFKWDELDMALFSSPLMTEEEMEKEWDEHN